MTKAKSLPRKKRANEVDVVNIYCRKCMKNKTSTEFFSATDNFIDANGYFSVCKSCCNDIYNLIFQSEGSVARALLRCCRMFNVAFEDMAVMATETHLRNLEFNGKKTDNVFGIYKSKLATASKKNFKDKTGVADITFVEPTTSLPPSDPIENHDKNAEQLKQFWGDNLNFNDYVWLEAEYAKWEADHKIKNSSEITLLKMIVLKLFDVRKARSEGHPTNKLEAEFQDLLKTSALTPAQANAASQGKIADTWGMIIKMVEEETPAEHYKDYKLFDDHFDLKKYLRDYVSRPITNFFNGHKNYSIEDEDVVLDSSIFESVEIPDIKTTINSQEGTAEGE